MKSSDAKASKCHLKFSSLMMIFVKLVYLSSVIYLQTNDKKKGHPLKVHSKVQKDTVKVIHVT